MTQYEYKVIPAPTRGEKAQGVKAPEGRFARTVEGVLNTQASEGWEYLRSDILPSDERQGLTSSQTVYRTLMVFRRARSSDDTSAEDVIQTAQDAAEAASQPAPETIPVVEPTRGDPADPPEAPDEPETPEPKPDTPKTE